jgi:hypothetical protein
MAVHVIEILDLQTGKRAKLTQQKKVREKPQTETVESFENQQHTHACSGTFNSNRYRSDQLPITSSPLTSSGFCQWRSISLHYPIY